MSIGKEGSGPGLHGGNRWAAARFYGYEPAEILDFSANINPLGLPASVRRVLANNLEAVTWYPDPEANEVKDEISQQTGIPRDYVLVGNGGAELIYLLASAFEPARAVVPAPTFSEYELAVKSRPGGVARRFLLPERDFCLDVGAFIAYLRREEAANQFNLVFLCNPNNPTGALVRRSDVLAIADYCATRGMTLVVDESFMDFVVDSSQYSVVTDVLSRPNLMVLKSLTKFYALPGLRLGYLLAEPVFGQRLRRLQVPWSVNVLAQMAGVAALRDQEYARQTKAWLVAERAYLSKSLADLGLRVYEPAANFILVGLEPTGPTSTEVWRLMAERRILVRDCRTFFGLNPYFLRLAVRTRSENERLIQALGEVLSR